MVKPAKYLISANLCKNVCLTSECVSDGVRASMEAHDSSRMANKEHICMSNAVPAPCTSTKPYHIIESQLTHFSRKNTAANGI